MHKDERPLTQKEKEIMATYPDKRQAELVKTILLFLDANIKPPEMFLDDVFSNAVKNGFPQEQVTKLKNLISKLPLRELDCLTR